MSEGVQFTSAERTTALETIGQWESKIDNSDIRVKIATAMTNNEIWTKLAELEEMKALKSGFTDAHVDLGERLSALKVAVEAVPVEGDVAKGLSRLQKGGLLGLAALSLLGIGTGVAFAARAGKFTALANSKAVATMSQWIKAADPRKLFA